MSTSRPSRFFVVPGSRLITRCATSNVLTRMESSSETRHPYVRPHSTSERNQSSAQYSTSFRYCPSSGISAHAREFVDAAEHHAHSDGGDHEPVLQRVYKGGTMGLWLMSATWR